MRSQGLVSDPPVRLSGLRIDTDIVCRRFDESVAYYRDMLGLPSVTSWSGVVRLDGGDGRWLTLWRGDPLDREGAMPRGRHSGATFHVEDVAGLRNSLARRGVVFASAPCRQPWGALMVNAEDPEGRLVTFLEMRSHRRDWRARPGEGDEPLAAAG